MAFLGCISFRLELLSVLPKTTPRKDPEDPVQLEPRVSTLLLSRGGILPLPNTHTHKLQEYRLMPTG